MKHRQPTQLHGKMFFFKTSHLLGPSRKCPFVRNQDVNQHEHETKMPADAILGQSSVGHTLTIVTTYFNISVNILTRRTTVNGSEICLVNSAA